MNSSAALPAAFYAYRQPNPSLPTTLWCATLLDPSGFPHDFKITAPSRQIALDRLAYYKPHWRIAEDPYGNPMIAREERLSS